jgi:hypothetical protein
MLFLSINYLDRRRGLSGPPGPCRTVFAFFALLLLALPARPQDPSPSNPSRTASDLFNRVISNQKKGETTLDLFERTERVEKRRSGADSDPLDTKLWRLFPTGTGVDKLALSLDGKPLNAESYRGELQKLENYLAWVAEAGPTQKEAYAKAQRKRKERFDLIEATHQAFLFTLEGKEMRGDRTLLRYSMTPNPDYQPTSRNTTLFPKVRGTLWIDEQSSELAKVEGSVTQDVSIAFFLAKVYKGSHFLQERYEVAPGVWEPTFEQYDFDGRKYLAQFSIHERTFYADYKRVGPPQEALAVVRAELNKLEANQLSH